MSTDLVDRRYVSRYSQPGFGLKVYVNGVLTDADANPVVSLMDQGASAVVWTATATKDPSPGSYSVLLPSTQTAVPGLGTLQWDYTIGSVPQVYGVDIEVGPSSPAYDALPPIWQDVIERAWIKFADLFDSPYGGPNLQVYATTHFGRNRLAQLLPDALQTLNATAQPFATYPLGGDNFPFDAWGALLSTSLYIEIVKHLVRSYVEQPEVILGTAISRVDRRDYMQRWSEILQMEQATFNRDLSRFKMANMGLGNVSVLVSGGAYGNLGSGEPPGGYGAVAARGYFYIARYH